MQVIGSWAIVPAARFAFSEEKPLNYCLERARDGDPAAIRRLVEEMRPRISKMASYYSRRCGEDADDLAQEAWLGFLEALPELDLTIGQPQQYLIACARWRMLDTVKRERIRRCSSLDDDLAEVALPPVPDAAFAAACATEFASHLKPTQRRVLRFLLLGLTWRETGERLGCASANVAYHVRIIRRVFRDLNAVEIPNHRAEI